MNTERQMTLEAPSIYQPIMLSILEITSMTEMEKVFTIELPFSISLEHKPGQFVQVSVLGVGEAPISISSSPSRSNNSFELCVRRVGALTNALHALGPGDVVGVRGPFGRGFPIERFRGKDILFAPGGLGLAPLRSVINEVLDDRSNYGRIIILYGARQPAEMLFQDELQEWEEREDVELHLTVDQADEKWKGNVGVITTLFPDIQVSPRNTVAITCGPPVMYRFVLMELLGMGITEGNIWLSLERRMKCGVGKCGHCQMDHIYVCQDGPAFSYAEIRHLEEAL
ncbi:MAG: FAD/NAD(P)-binding protein [Anaerolineales bacterium]|nr:FAD/NAD(P)-binding protein [Anaerolineales bacterium]